MRALLLAALALVLLPTVAQAQQMPDPRQMSGVPRPDQQVKLGTATVRLVHGELARNAEEGIPVHMVALRADGSAERITRPLDKNGRASFDGLATDGSVAYYAFALLGEDRLESDLVVLDKMAGVRLMLVGRKLDAQGQPVGTPIDDAAGEDQSVKQPPGEVWILVGGRGVGLGAPVELVAIPEAGKPAQVVQTVDLASAGNQQFVARFANVPGGPDQLYLARVKVGSRYHNSKPFMMRPGAGAGRTLLVIDQIIVSTHIACEVDDSTLRVQAQYVLQNFQGGPYDPGPGGLELPLPAGAIGGSLAEESPRVKIDPGKKIIWKGVIPPGQTEILSGYGLPIEDGVVHFDLEAPLGLFQSTIVVEQSPGASMSPITVDVADPELAKQMQVPRAQERETEDGRKFFFVSPVQVPVKAALHFSVSGLPQHPRSQKIFRNGALLLVLVLVVMALFVTIFDPFQRRGARADASGKAAAPGEGGARTSMAKRKELTARREQLYDELVTLERKRAAQQIDDDRYETTRQVVVSRLTLVLRELDQLDAAGSPRAS